MAANTTVLSREAAFEALRSVSQRPAAIAGVTHRCVCSVRPDPRELTLRALVAVYAYWLAKRKRLGKPVLRRLQPPPAVTDPNPFAVFRPREKTHRPQTRRRRENDIGAFSRMRSLRGNLDTSRAILEWLQRRERRKRDILACEMDAQLLQLRARHDPRLPAQARCRPRCLRLCFLTPGAQPVEVPPAEPEQARVKHQLGARCLGEQQALPGPNGPALDRATMQQLTEAAQKREKKRRRDGRERRGPDPAYVPPPEPPEPEMPFLGVPDFYALGIAVPAAAHSLCGQARFGRGGRIVIDRVDPIWKTPLVAKSAFPLN
jgi:enhancer of polycomb-like protein